MEILAAILLILAVAAIALAAKHGAEAAQMRREERWGGFAPPAAGPVGAPAGRAEFPAPRARGAGSAQAGTAGASPGPSATPKDRPAKSPPLRPPEAAPAPSPAAKSGGPSPARAALRAFRRTGSGDDGGEQGSSRREGLSVAVAPPPARRSGAAPGLSRAGEARRAVGTAAESAGATARAVRATASAALRRQPARVDINTASASDLQSLPGVGIRAAQRIVAHRESNGHFASVEDLGEVEGFDQHRVSRLAQRATV